MGIEFQNRKVKTWNLLPSGFNQESGSLDERKSFVETLSHCFTNCESVKIATAYLSNFSSDSGDILDLQEEMTLKSAFNIAFRNKKIELLQVDVDPNVNTETARWLVDEFKDRLRVVKTPGLSMGKVHHKEFVFKMPDRYIKLSGSMNLTRSGIESNGETVIAIEFSQEEESKANALFDSYSEASGCLIHSHDEWVRYIKKKRSSDEALKEYPKIPLPKSTDEFNDELIGDMFSEIKPFTYLEFIEQLKRIDLHHKSEVDQRKKASAYLRHLYSSLELNSLDEEGKDDIQCLLSQKKWAQGGEVDCHALGNIRFGKGLSEYFSIDNYHKVIPFLISIKSGDEAKIRASYKELSGSIKEPTLGLFSRLASIAEPNRCFTYNGLSKSGINKILRKLGFFKKLSFENYYEACDLIAGASFLNSMNLEEQGYEFVNEAKMHYLDLVLYLD